MRGRKPKHPRLAKLQAGRRRPAGEIPSCPDWLCGVGRQEWERIVAELSKSYDLTGLDQATLAIYCDLYADMLRLREELNEEGSTVSTEHGVKANPKRKQWEWTLAEMRRMAAEFGFSPAARSRIEPALLEDEETDELEDFLDGKPQ